MKENNEQAKRLNHILLIGELQVLFANMIMSNKKYADPTKVLQLLSKDPQIGDIGDQKDAGEFNVAFLSLICEGFQAIAENQSPQEEENKEQRKEERLSSSGSKVSLKKSIIEHAPRGISQTFFGELQEVVSYVQNQKTQQNSNFVQFGQVMLDVDHKDLYEAWEHSFYNEIDGYKPEDSEEPTRAIQELWIKQAPNVVLFQLQRVKYDLKAGTALKTNKRFKFPKELFIDRYLRENMETGRKIREKVEELRKKASLLTQNLEMYQVNKNEASSLSSALLPSILGETINLLKRQNENPGIPAHPFSSLKLQSPFALNIPNQKLDEVSKVLIGMKEALEQQIISLQKQLSAIKEEINLAYRGIQKTAFDLYGVLVHDGQSAEYGHYYAFIYDQEMQKWRKYNDMNVTEVTEEEVFADSEGGSSSGKSAYCLLYQKRKEGQRLPPSLDGSMMVRSFSIQSEDVKDEVGQEFSIDYYNQMVPLSIADQIREENKKLAQELQQFKNKQVMDQIHEMFKLKLAKVKNLAQKQKNKTSQFKMQLLSFPLFLYIDKQRQFFCKWVILNQIVQQVHPEGLGLKQLEALRGPFWDGLSSLKSSYPSQIPDLVLYASQEQTLKDDSIEYYLKLQQSMYNMLTFKAILEERWDQALRTGSKGSRLNQTAKEKNIKISKSLCKDSAKVLLLFLCSETSKMLQEKNTAKLLEFANCLSYGIHFLPESDSHRKVIEEKMKQHLEKNAQFFGGQENKTAYEAILQKGLGKSQDNDPFEAWANLTDELKVWNPKCSPTYEEALQEWRDDWGEEDLCVSESRMKEEFLNRFKKFVDCHKKLSNEKWKLEDYYAVEKELGIEE